MSGPVYEVRVTLKGRPALVPMTVVAMGVAWLSWPVLKLAEVLS